MGTYIDDERQSPRPAGLAANAPSAASQQLKGSTDPVFAAASCRWSLCDQSILILRRDRALVTIILFTLLNSGTNVAFHTGRTHMEFSGHRDAGCLYVYVSTISDNRNHRRRLTGGKPAGLAVVYSDRCAGGGNYERNSNTPNAGPGRGLDRPCGHLAQSGGDPQEDGRGSPGCCCRRAEPARPGASVAPRRNSVLPAIMARSGISGCFAATEEAAHVTLVNLRRGPAQSIPETASARRNTKETSRVSAQGCTLGRGQPTLFQENSL